MGAALAETALRQFNKKATHEGRDLGTFMVFYNARLLLFDFARWRQGVLALARARLLRYLLLPFSYLPQCPLLRRCWMKADVAWPNL
jgi:hypothetical protein